MKLADYFKLCELYRRRSRSEEDYRKFQSFQARLIMEYLNKFLIIQGQLVLDLGGGLGGYSLEMAKGGVAGVIYLDIAGSLCPPEPKVYPITADALSIPLRNESVDFVFCASLIEHIKDPSLLLREINRVLKRGHFCYLSFPPFYSPLGGHNFSPFHYFGEKIALKIYSFLQKKHPDWVVKVYKPSQNPRSFDSLYQGWGLFKLTISKAVALIRETGWEIVDISPRYIPINTAKIKFFGEILTLHVQFLIKKKQ